MENFKNYKEKQAFFKDKYENRGEVIHVSKVIGKENKVLQVGTTYYSEKGEIRALKRMEKQNKKSKKAM